MNFFKDLHYRFLFNFSSTKKRFKQIYKDNYWSSDESVSGPGSNLEMTKTIRLILPEIIDKYNIKSLFDIPCGDFNWMKNLDFSSIKYLGGDIVDDLIFENQKKYTSPNRSFQTLDLISDPLPSYDMILVRDCFIHLSNDLILECLKNIKNSGSRYLLTNCFRDIDENINIKTGTWRRINLTLPPFNLPFPLEEWEEIEHLNQVTGRKLTVLYEIDSLPF